MLALTDRLGGVSDGTDAGSAGRPASGARVWSEASTRSRFSTRVLFCPTSRPRTTWKPLRHVAATRCTCGAGSRISRSPRTFANWRSRRVDCCCATTSTSSAGTSTGVAATSGYWVRWGPARGGARGSRGEHSSGSTTRSTGCAAPATSGRCVPTGRRAQLIRCTRSWTRTWCSGSRCCEDADLVEGGQGAAVQQRASDRWQSHLGRVFEEAAPDHTVRMITAAELAPAMTVGRWWRDEVVEVDVLGLFDGRTRLLGEARWQASPVDTGTCIR